MGRSQKDKSSKDGTKNDQNEYVRFDFKIYRQMIDDKYNLRMKLQKMHLNEAKNYKLGKESKIFEWNDIS